MLREVLRDLLHLVIFLDLACGVVLFALAVRTSLFRAGEYLDRRGSMFSLRSPLPSEFSKEYYASYWRSLWLGFAFLFAVAIGMILLRLDQLLFGSATPV